MWEITTQDYIKINLLNHLISNAVIWKSNAINKFTEMYCLNYSIYYIKSPLIMTGLAKAIKTQWVAENDSFRNSQIHENLALKISNWRKQCQKKKKSKCKPWQEYYDVSK